MPVQDEGDKVDQSDAAGNEPGHTSAATNESWAPWLTTEQAIIYLGLPSPKSLYQAVRRGQVPAHHFGRRLRFSRAELDRMLTDS